MSIMQKPVEDTVEILVVEDSPTQAKLLRHLLEQHHYRVRVADDGKQALCLLAEHKPTLVISDVVMPEMDGFELCKRIKGDESTKDIPVVLLTALVESEDVFEGLACGADNFITKPYSEDYLVSSLENILINKKLCQGECVRVKMEVVFAGKRRFITTDQQQVLFLLLSTYEAAIQRNMELARTHEELRLLNERLEDLVKERTAVLITEIAGHKRAEEALKQQTSELRARNEELIRFNRASVDRELHMIELKQELNELCRRLGEPPRYAANLPPGGGAA